MAVGGSWLILGGGGFAVVVGCESCDGDGGSDLVGWGGVGGWVGGWWWWWWWWWWWAVGGIVGFVFIYLFVFYIYFMSFFRLF